MKREQIIEIFKGFQILRPNKYGKAYSLPDIHWEQVADAILSMQIDVPSEEEINKMAYNACMKPSMPNGEPEPEHRYYDAYIHGANEMKQQIIERNK